MPRGEQWILGSFLDSEKFQYKNLSVQVVPPHVFFDCKGTVHQEYVPPD